MAEPFSINEFQRLGYLQEVNRQFFHPLGLSLAIRIDDQGNKRLYTIFDHTDNPEGAIFKPGMIDHVKAQFVEREMDKRGQERMKQLGFVVQPLE